MSKILSRLLDSLSNYFAKRKGLLPMIGIALILLNFILSVLLDNWLSTSGLFLHLGIIIAIIGFMLQKAL